MFVQACSNFSVLSLDSSVDMGVASKKNKIDYFTKSYLLNNYLNTFITLSK